MTMRIFARFARRRKRLPADTAQSRVYGFALRQIEARRAMGLVYPDQYPDERHETDRYLGKAS